MKAVCFYEKSVNLYEATWRHIKKTVVFLIIVSNSDNWNIWSSYCGKNKSKNKIDKKGQATTSLKILTACNKLFWPVPNRSITVEMVYLDGCQWLVTMLS